MRILHLPTDVGGNSYYLSLGEKKIGLDSTVLVYKSSKYHFPNDINLHFEKYHWAIQEIKKVKAFFSYGLKYDIFVFNFGGSFILNPRFLGFLNGIDLPFLRGLGKKIVTIYQGCDARQKDFSISHFNISACAEPNYNIGACSKCNKKTDDFKRRQIKWFSHFSHKIFTVNPDLLYLIPKGEFIPYTAIDPSGAKPLYPDPSLKKVTILHAPTERGIKGSHYILPILERLSNKYPFVEILLAEGIPQEIIFSYYQKADIFVDQILVGWYGGAAVQAMAFGTPTVCYIREKDLSFLPSSLVKDLPIINATKYNLYDVLVELIHNKEKLREIGKKSRAYVEKYHDPVKIAKKMKKVYESIFQSK